VPFLYGGYRRLKYHQRFVVLSKGRQKLNGSDAAERVMES
jgi:hypothetical protein